MSLLLTSPAVVAEATRCYERIRSDARARDGGPGTAPGMAVLLRKGMAAWMVALLPGPTVGGSGPPASPVDPAPRRDLQPELASTLAGMILGQQREAHR